MTCRIVPLVVSLIFAAGATAQESGGRLDLEAIAPLTKLATARVMFSKTATACPEDFGILRISARELRYSRPMLPGRPAIWGAVVARPDDNTHLFRLTTQDCRFDIAIRQQIRSGENWSSLLVPRRFRPSVPEEERRALGRETVEQMKERSKSGPLEMPEHLRKAFEAARVVGSVAQGGDIVGSSAAQFDDAPETCFEAVGDYVIDGQGVAFLFAIGLPGDLNRFTIERTDIDDDHSRFHFTRGDCRFELTIGKSVRQDGQWSAVAVAPFIKASQPRLRIDIRRKVPERGPAD